MHIRWTGPAVGDLTRICDYLEEQSSAATARRVALVICEDVESLAQFPNRGRIGRKVNTRELVIPKLPYLVIYRVRGESVEILSHSTRRPALALG